MTLAEKKTIELLEKEISDLAKISAVTQTMASNLLDQVKGMDLKIAIFRDRIGQLMATQGESKAKVSTQQKNEEASEVPA